MAEAQKFIFTNKEVVEALIKKQDIHEGLWQLYVEFSLGAANIPGPKSGELVPAALVGLTNIGITKVDEPNNLTVDASAVNPLPSAPQKPAKRKRTPSEKPTE